MTLLPTVGPLGDELITAYADPARHYHDLRHLTQVLDAVDALAEHARDLAAVRLAAWFHDAVYDVHATDNEERSARWAERALAEVVGPDELGEVARLVRLTATHAAGPDDANGIVLCDADLSILAGDPDQYAAYTRAVRVEYAHVPEEEFRSGRARVLEQLLALPRLYGTPVARAEWEPAARANVEHEIAHLREQRPR